MPIIDEETMNKIHEYLKYLHTHEEPKIEQLPNLPFEEIVGEELAEFMDLDKELIFKMYKASEYLDIRSLVRLCSATIGYNIKGYELKDVAGYYGIENWKPENEKTEEEKEEERQREIFEAEEKKKQAEYRALMKERGMMGGIYGNFGEGAAAPTYSQWTVQHAREQKEREAYRKQIQEEMQAEFAQLRAEQEVKKQAEPDADLLDAWEELENKGKKE